MRKSLQAGDSAMQGIIILAILLVIVITLPEDDRRVGTNTPGSTISSISDAKSDNGSFFNRDADDDNDNGGTAGGTTLSTASQTQYVSLGIGNARYSYQPYEEYITIENKGKNPVNITGWQLRNGKDKRPYYLNGSMQRFSADLALIPRATRLLLPFGNSFEENVVLAQGEKAIITTGRVGVREPFLITSFKENMCTGYIENHSDYAFTPPLTRNCPQPRMELGQENLDGACRDFIRTLPSCQVPTFGGKDKEDEPCSNCVNGKRISSVCVSFIKERFNYQGCVANHSSDPKFSSRTWRIFLGRGWEMWADKYETIELFNSLGQLVDYENY